MTYKKLSRAHTSLIKLAYQDMPLDILVNFVHLLDYLSEPLNDYYVKLEKINMEMDKEKIEILENTEFSNDMLPLHIPMSCDLRLSYTDIQLLKGIIEIDGGI